MPCRRRRVGATRSAPAPAETVPRPDATALNFVGVRYKRGGNSPRPASTAAASPATSSREPRPASAAPRRRAGRPHRLVEVAREDLKPGDLVFFNTLGRTFSHVGIYLGDNRFIHSPRTGSDVRIDDIASPTGRGASPARVARPRAPRRLRAPCTSARTAPDRSGRRRDTRRGRLLAVGSGAGRHAGTIGAWAEKDHRRRRPPLSRAARRASRRNASRAHERRLDRLRPAAARPAHLGHRSMQLPLQLLHAQGGLRQPPRVPAAVRAAELRRDHAPGRPVRRRPACASCA